MNKLNKKKKFIFSYMSISVLNFFLNQTVFNILIFFLSSNVSAIMTMFVSSSFGIFTTVKYYQLQKNFLFICKYIVSILVYRIFDYLLFNLLKSAFNFDVSIIWFVTIALSLQTKIIFYYFFLIKIKRLKKRLYNLLVQNFSNC